MKGNERDERDEREQEMKHHLSKSEKKRTLF